MNVKGEYFERLRSQKMDRTQKFGFIFLASFILMLMIPSITKQGIGMTLAQLGIAGSSFILIILMFFYRNDGKHVVDFGELVKKGCNWEMLILIAATMPIAAAMEDEQTGIVKTVVTTLTNIFSNYSSAVFLVAAVLIFVISTQFIHNLVLMFVFIPSVNSIYLSITFLRSVISLWILSPSIFMLT